MSLGHSRDTQDLVLAKPEEGQAMCRKGRQLGLGGWSNDRGAVKVQDETEPEMQNLEVQTRASAE
jgi:hypothetical protein